jgi:hypothetical protein
VTLLDGAALYGGRSLAAYAAWEEHRALGLRRGWTVPPLTVVADITPLPAWIQQGALVVSCPECAGTKDEELHPVWLDGPHLMFCAVCGNCATGGQWRLVALPEHLAEIAALLSVRPPQARNCLPGQTVDDLVAENAEHTTDLMAV